MDDQSQKGEEDLVTEVHQIILLAQTKKGYKKRLEKLEGRLRELQLMEKELEILKRQQDLADFSAIRSQITEMTTANDEQTTMLATALTRAIKDELLPPMKEELLTSMKEVITTEVQKQLQKHTLEGEEDFPTLPQTYATKLKQPPKEHPTLIIAPKDANLPTHKLRHELNNCTAAAPCISNCFATRGGKLVIHCKDATAKEKIQEVMAQNKELANIATITESKPRLMKLMIFGAPQAPSTTTRFKQGEDLPDQLKEYLDTFLTPNLQKDLKKDLPQLRYKLNMVIQAPKQRSHLVVEMSEADAAVLLNKGKILLGFNSCTIKRYVNVIRCFKCQRYGHTSAFCQNAPCCVNCGGDHPPVGQGETCPAPPNCINCSEKKQLEIIQYREKKINKYTIFTTKHKASDRQCEVYKSHLQIAQAKIAKSAKSLPSRSS